MKESYSFDSTLSRLMKEQVSDLGLSCNLTTINNREYYELLLNPKSNLNIEGFLRLENNRILHTSLDGKSEQLFLDFSSKGGDSWTFNTIPKGQVKITNFNKMYDKHLNDSLQLFVFKITKSANDFSSHYPQLRYVTARQDLGIVTISIETAKGISTYRLIPFTKVAYYKLR